MKYVKVTITLWEKGDRVLTPEGIGTVTEDEAIPKLPSSVYGRTIKVKLDEGTSSHPNGELEIWDPEMVLHEGPY